MPRGIDLRSDPLEFTRYGSLNSYDDLLARIDADADVALSRIRDGRSLRVIRTPARAYALLVEQLEGDERVTAYDALCRFTADIERLVQSGNRNRQPLKSLHKQIQDLQPYLIELV